MRLARVLIQPVAADDVATVVAWISVGSPLNGLVEAAGPQQIRLDELIRRSLREREDPREVITDPRARCFGAQLKERTLVPGGDASLADTGSADWLRRSAMAE